MELTIKNIVYYVIPGGKPTLLAHPNECPLIVHNKPLDEIMHFGDDWRMRGRTPCVVLPSPSLGGALGQSWNNHADPSGLLDNIAAHIEGYIVDLANTETPELPSVWRDTKDAPNYIFWERKNQDVLYRGSHNQFVTKFGFDPEEPDEQPGGDPGGGTVPGTVISGARIKTIRIPAFEIQVIYETDDESVG